MTDSPTFKKNTRIVTLGRSPEEFGGAVNPPLIRTSTVLFPTLKDYDAAQSGTYPGRTYGRYGTATVIALETMLAELEGADHAIITSSGVSAITTSLLSFLSTGDHLLMVDTAYDPTRKFCDNELKRLGINTTYYDPNATANELEALIQDNTKVLFVESPGSLTMEVQDVPALATVAHAHDMVVISDSTWATPLYFRPFEKGVDVSVHSATKYINGHSDAVMGAITTTDKHYNTILSTHKNLGACANSGDCYLAQRGMRTLGARMVMHQLGAIKVANWLRQRPEVAEVRYPALPGSPGHEIWKRDFTGAAGLFTILLKENYSHAALAAMLDNLQLFGMGYSWGGFESLIIPIKPGAFRTAKPWAHKGSVLRLHIGLEDADDLIADLEAGLERLNKASAQAA